MNSLEPRLTILVRLLKAALAPDCPIEEKPEELVSLLNGAPWVDVLKLAANHGVMAIAWDGYQAITERVKPARLALDEFESLNIRLSWKLAVQEQEKNYQQYRESLGRLGKIYSDANLKILILKGYGLSLNYPVPQHRITGDIDVYEMEGRSYEADKLIHDVTGSKIERSKRSHHSHASFEGILLENHLNLRCENANPLARTEREKLLTDALGIGDAPFNTANGSANAAAGRNIGDARNNANAMTDAIKGSACTPLDLDGARLYLPSPTFNAIFLMNHMSRHSRVDGFALRQICDWMTFVQRHSAEVDWEYVQKAWEKLGITDYAQLVNGLLVKYLGMDRTLVPAISEDGSKIDGLLSLAVVFGHYTGNHLRNFCITLGNAIKRKRVFRGNSLAKVIWTSVSGFTVLVLQKIHILGKDADKHYKEIEF